MYLILGILGIENRLEGILYLLDRICLLPTLFWCRGILYILCVLVVSDSEPKADYR